MDEFGLVVPRLAISSALSGKMEVGIGPMAGRNLEKLEIDVSGFERISVHCRPTHLALVERASTNMVHGLTGSICSIPGGMIGD